MRSPMSKMLTFVGIFFVIIFGIYGAKKLIVMWFMAHYQPPAVTISATKAERKNWQSYVTAVGSFTAVNGVDIAAEAPGIVKEIRFNSGQMVKKGDVLLVQDIAIQEAALKSYEAKLALARINYDREKQLFDRHVTSPALLDARYAEWSEAQANVDSARAEIQQKIITAPFDGRIGIRQVDLGEYLSPGTVIVTLQSQNPLYVMLNLPDQYLPQLYIHQPVDIMVNFGKERVVHGTITAINSKVDPITRNILIQATVPNDEHVLYPGMFAMGKIWFQQKQNAIVIPQTAVSFSLSGDYVFLIKDESHQKGKTELHAYRQYVKVGERRENEVAILEGLKPGDEVVTSGQLKLQNGTPVVIDNSVEL
jgi:membrane fusion protein, multidrug efflux system